MSTLALIILGIAALLALCGATLLSGTQRAAQLWNALPRSTWAGRILALIALTWAALLVNEMEMGFLNVIKTYLIPLAIAIYILTCMYMSDLLSCRALGGIAVLIPGPLLAAARFYPSPLAPSPARLIAVSIAYIMIVKGIAFILYPYLLRRAIQRITQTPRSMRTAGITNLIVAAILCVLALTAYRALPLPMA